MKKLLALLFSAAIVSSLAMPVFARGSGAGEETKEKKTEAPAAKTKAAKTHAAKTKAKAATKKVEGDTSKSQ